MNRVKAFRSLVMRAALGLALAVVFAPAASAAPESCPEKCYCVSSGFPLECPTWDLPECNENPDCQGGPLPTPWPGPDGCVNNPGSCVTIPGGGGVVKPKPGNQKLHAATCAVIEEANCWSDPAGCIKEKIVEKTGVPADVIFPSPGYVMKYTCYTCCLLLSQTPQGGYPEFQLNCQDCCDGTGDAWCKIDLASQ